MKNGINLLALIVLTSVASNLYAGLTPQAKKSALCISKCVAKSSVYCKTHNCVFQPEVFCRASCSKQS